MANPKRFLQQWHGIWSIPLAILLFILVGSGIAWWMGPEAGVIEPAHIQRIFYGSCAMIAANFFVWFSIYFSFRGIWKYYNQDSGTDFKSMSAKFKIVVTLGMYIFYTLEFMLFIIFI